MTIRHVDAGSLRECGECQACTVRWPQKCPPNGDEVRRSRDFQCLWLEDQDGAWLEDELRPDQSGVILVGTSWEGKDSLLVAETKHLAADRPPFPSKLEGLERSMYLIRERPNGKRKFIRTEYLKQPNHSGVLPFIRARGDRER